MQKSRNMVYKHLFWQVIIRVVLISLSALALAFFIVLPIEVNLMTIFVLSILILLQVFLFIKTFIRINKDLENFFDSVYALDSSISFRGSMVSKEFGGLYDRLKRINTIIGGLKINIEEQNEYYEKITNQMPNAIISYYDDGKIALVNPAFEKLFKLEGLNKLSNIRDLKDEYPDVVKFLTDHDSPVEEVIKVKLADHPASLVVKTTTAHIRRKRIMIASLQNIEQELESREMESWQSLLRVLTHEIANSIGPISSTIETLEELLQQGDETQTNQKLKFGLSIINERSQGLLKLLGDIRSFSSFSKPEIQRLNIDELLDDVSGFVIDDLKKDGISLQVEKTGKEIGLYADKQLISHVLINLITNAHEALMGNDNPKIRISAETDNEGFVFIRVIDNGPGIDNENAHRILIPFFTTKETGSGIGLSISREIMRQHNGKLLVSSRPGYTEFSLRFAP